MDEVFKMSKFFPADDGTLVALNFNSIMQLSGMTFETDGSFSVATGRIVAGKKSAIHFHPYVTQLTLVGEGKLIITMKDKNAPDKYSHLCEKGDAMLTEIGTFLEFHNTSDQDCYVYYIVSPAFLFEEDVYTDAVVCPEDWGGLAKKGWVSDAPVPTKEEREACLHRLSGQSG